MKMHSRNTPSWLKYFLFVLCLTSGCSVYMEATRPTPVDLAKFTPGESRLSVLEQVGAPVTTTKDRNGSTCDLELLYITGYGAPVKVPLAILEGAADFFSIGLAEIILSPTESVTRNEKKPVWLCYKNDSLLTVTVASSQSETAAASPSPSATPTEASASASPTASATTTATASPSPTPTSSSQTPERSPQ
jgi:hypothetical protein